jgi:hypothetical protein
MTLRRLTKLVDDPASAPKNLGRALAARPLFLFHPQLIFCRCLDMVDDENLNGAGLRLQFQP